MNQRKLKLAEPILIQALQEKTDLGARALYEIYGSNLLGMINRIVPDLHQAEDILQEALVRIWCSFERYDATKGRLFTWLLNIARHMAIDAVRSKRYREHALTDELEISGAEIAFTERTEEKLDSYFLRSGLAGLKPKERQVLELIYFKGYKHTEAAVALAMPLGSIKTCCRSGIASLRRWHDQPAVLRAAS